MLFAPRVRTVAIGWCLVVLFGLLVLALRGLAELRSVPFFVGLPLLMLLWLRLRPGRAAVVTSLVLGLLHSVEQVAYLVANLTDDRVSASSVAGDGFGLIGGLVVVVGAIAALRRPSPAMGSATAAS